MEFLKLDRNEFDYGVVSAVAPHVRRVVAENPSKFTYHGTGTYIVGEGDVAVIDPGPRLDAHRNALAVALAGETVRAILITHCHADHSPLAAWLAAETGAPTFAYGPHGDDGLDLGALPDDFGRDPAAERPEEPANAPVVEETTDREFVPDVAVRTGDACVVGNGWTVRALHTPGHTSNHTCFEFDAGADRILFTGDHVMGWSTTVVSPPDGDMSAYLESLRTVARRDDALAIPTHGPPIPRPSAYVRRLIEHRVGRERQVLTAVGDGLATIPDIVTRLYADVRVELYRPAASSVLAHLTKLVDDGAVAVATGDRARFDSRFVPVAV